MNHIFLKNLQKISLLSTLIIVGSCHSDDPSKSPQTLYTVVFASFDTSKSDDWVMVSDAEGNWLDAKPYEGGDSIVLTGDMPANKTVTLHFFKQDNQTSTPYIVVRSYTNLAASDKWKEVLPNFNRSTFGTAAIQLNNIQFDTGMPFSASSSSGDIGYGSSYSLNTLNLTDLSLFENPANLMFSYFKNGTPYNVMVNSVTPGANVSADASTTEKPMDVTFDFDYTGDSFFQAFFYGQVSGTTPVNMYSGYNLSSFYAYGSSGSVTLGYQHGFDNYTFDIYHQKGGSTYEYSKIGEAITQAPTFPTLGLSASGAVAPQFSVTPSLDFDMAELRITSQAATGPIWNWYVELPKPSGSSELNFNLKTLPPQMTTLFSMPDLSQIKLKSVAVWQHLDGFGYTDYVNVRKNSTYAYSKEFYVISSPL